MIRKKFLVMPSFQKKPMAKIATKKVELVCGGESELILVQERPATE